MRIFRWPVMLALVVAPASLAAQERRPSHCVAVAEAPAPPLLQKASFRAPPADEWSIRIRYIDHSMFLIQTAGGLDVVTDYTGFLGPVDFVPDVVTMNNAHSSHWTSVPDPRIPHVLPGWWQDGAPAEHYLDLSEVLVRNVTTDQRAGERRVKDNNSIFVFEMAGLCVAHLGHLHHEPSEDEYAALGRIDVLMAAVDGGYTVNIPTMVKIVERLRSSVVIPMHWFSGASLERFLSQIGPEFDVVREGTSETEISLRTLPSRPTILVLEPEFLRDE